MILLFVYNFSPEGLTYKGSLPLHKTINWVNKSKNCVIFTHKCLEV